MRATKLLVDTDVTGNLIWAYTDPGGSDLLVDLTGSRPTQTR